MKLFDSHSGFARDLHEGIRLGEHHIEKSVFGISIETILATLLATLSLRPSELEYRETNIHQALLSFSMPWEDPGDPRPLKPSQASMVAGGMRG